MKNKKLQQEINDLYLSVFLDLNNYDKFEFKDTRTYANYDDYIDNYYISPSYKLNDSDHCFRFYIKKHWFNYRIEVRTVPTVEMNNYHRKFNIYKDTLHLKRKGDIKSKIMDIIDYVDYNEIMKKVQGNLSFARKMKLKKLKNRLV